MLAINTDPNNQGKCVTEHLAAQKSQRATRFGSAQGFACGLSLVCLALCTVTNTFAQSDPPVSCVPDLDALAEFPTNRPLAELPLLEALTGLNVQRESTATEGEQRYFFNISREGTSLLQVIPDASGGPYAVVIRDARVARRLGYTIGDSHRQWGRTEVDIECDPGAEELSGSVLCSVPQRPAWLLRFDGDWQGPDGSLPPPDVLAGWILSEVIWLVGSEQSEKAPKP